MSTIEPHSRNNGLVGSQANGVYSVTTIDTCLYSLQLGRFDQHRDHASCPQPELPVPDDPHQTCDSARVAGQAQDAGILAFILEHLVQ